jgi:hypothetical protein
MGLTLLEVLGGGVDEFQSDELETTLLEAADDVADETALDAVRLYRYNADDGSSSSTIYSRWMGDQGRPHLDHDVRAFVSGRHERCFLFWKVMDLTKGGKREMGRCEKERADFKQQKADHPVSTCPIRR